MMRCITILCAAMLSAAAAGPLHAQSLETFKQRLAQPVVSEVSFGTARVTATEYGDAAQAVADAAPVEPRHMFKGYRVCIFVDNGQDARSGAEAALNLFREAFPGIRAYKVYDTPYFRVTVGNCLTAEEAIILKGRVSGIFPKAFPKSEQLSLSDFLN